MYLVRHVRNSPERWVFDIGDFDFFIGRGPGMYHPMQIRRTPHAWDWETELECGVSAIGESEEDAIRLLEEREKLQLLVDSEVLNG